jgi:hypothetical protein
MPLETLVPVERYVDIYPAGIGSIVPLGRGYFPHDPGISCLATIACPSGTNNAPWAERPFDGRMAFFPPGQLFVLSFGNEIHDENYGGSKKAARGRRDAAVV